MGASLAKLGDLQDQLVLSWQLGKEKHRMKLVLFPHPSSGIPILQSEPTWQLLAGRGARNRHEVAKLGLWHDLKVPPLWVFFGTIWGDY